MCLAGASGAGAELLAGVPAPGLRVRYVWVPVLPPDDLAAATAAAGRLAEPRATHYFDPQRALGQQAAAWLDISSRQSLGVEGGPGLAWDVYLAYGPGDTDIARPAFWMHQLGVKHAPRLDAPDFRRRVEGLLGA